MPRTWDSSSLSPEQALQRLVDGNRSFLEADGAPSGRPWSRRLATEGQRPFAVVLGCSDSRTPVEILFDQGFGDLFVVRNAGNIAVPSVVGSIEFAVSQFGTRLAVVMGHTGCGAIAATASAIEAHDAAESNNIRAITEHIAPNIRELLHAAPKRSDRDDLLREAMRAHVRATVDQLRHGSELLSGLVAAGRVAIVGAEYELETGTVHFLDEGGSSDGSRGGRRKRTAAGR